MVVWFGTLYTIPPDLPTALGIPRSDSGPGLKALAEHFGLKMKKETRVARSDWATFQLSKDAGLGLGRF